MPLPVARFGQPPDPILLMRHYLQICDADHPQCKFAKHMVGPASVVDVSAFSGSQDVRLVEYASVASQPFVCLSHCWGSLEHRPIVTTKYNIMQHMEGIRFEELSRTFQDAVTVTRDLGYRYLWIDSLFIIQYDDADWEQEARKMPSIYGGSALTLAALNSQDGRGGFQIRDNDIVGSEHNRYVDVQFGKQGIRIFESEPIQWHEEYGDTTSKESVYGTKPLRRRAWTLQERGLPVRKISFSGSTLLWECNTSKGSTQVPWEAVEPYHDRRPMLDRTLVRETLNAARGRDLWTDVIEDYTSRLLTVESDKLPALSGMCHTMLPYLRRSQYLAGLWRDHLPSALLWRTEPGLRDPNGKAHASSYPTRPKVHRAPSWSWASLDGAVSYAALKSNVEFPMDNPYDAELERMTLQIQEAQATPSGKDTTGAVSTASLTVVGRKILLRFSSRPQRIEDVVTRERSPMDLTSSDGAHAGLFYPDIRSEMAYHQEVHCLHVQAEPNDPLDRQLLEDPDDPLDRHLLEDLETESTESVSDFNWG